MSVTSLVMDKMTKSRIYAATNVPQYCIVDVAAGAVHVHTEPEPSAGRYRMVATVRRGDQIDLVGLPGATVAVSDILGPAVE